MSESRFLQSFSALLASAILVCGTHILLIASSEYGRPEAEQQPAPIVSLAPAAAPATPREAIEVEITGATPDRSHPESTPYVGDQTAIAASAPAEAAPPEPLAQPEPVQTAEAEGPTSGPDLSSSVIEKEPVASAAEPATPALEPTTSGAEPSDAPKTVEPLQAAEADTEALAEPPVAEAASPATSQPEPVGPAAESSEVVQQVEPAKTAEVETKTSAEPQVAEADTPVTSQPEPVVPVAEPGEVAQQVEPGKTVEAETKASTEPQGAETAPPAPEANAQQTAAADAPATPVPPAPKLNAVQTAIADVPAIPTPVVTAPEPLSEPKVAAANATTHSNKTAEAEPAPPSVPLPARKPAPSVAAKTAKAVAKPTPPAAEAPVQEAATESKPRWTPMALAPADKDTVAKPQLTPKRVEGASGYNAKIWSALARHKPRAGKAGSAAVTFSIGPAGGLLSARISGSSGDSQLDQMALQTVRNAAPFPPPPNPASASYTIRIYFR